MNEAEETVIYGSVYEALYSGFVKNENILEYLLDTQPENEYQRKKMCIAYRIICIYSKNQFIRGKHFICLTDNNDYISIYCLSFQSLTLENEDNKTNYEITQKIQKIIPKFIDDVEYYRFFYVLCGISDDNFVFEEHHNMIIASTRNLKHIDKVMDDVFCILGADYLSILELLPKNNYIYSLIDRCIYLEDCAPLYWKNVAYPIYSNFIKNHLYSGEGFTKNLLLTYNYYFPNIFSEKILNKSETALYLSNLSNEICAYYLGFPIHKYIPNKNILEESIDKLDELGTEKYCEEILKNKMKHNVANNQNVEMDNIELFNTFDIVSYYDGNNHLFRFTRCEFDKLIKDGKNFYTGEMLPYFVIEKIKCRNNIANKYKLPKSQPLEELLINDKIEEDERISIDENTEIITEDDSDEDERYIIGKVRNRITGIESIIHFPVTEDIDDSDIDEYMENILDSRDIDYICRIECTCIRCNIESEIDIDVD